MVSKLENEYRFGAIGETKCVLPSTQRELESVILVVSNQRSGSRKRHPGIVRIMQIREHDAVPVQTFRRDVLDVENPVREAFIEDART